MQMKFRVTECDDGHGMGGRGLSSRGRGGVSWRNRRGTTAPKSKEEASEWFGVSTFSSGFPFGGSVQARIARCPVPPQGLLRGGISPQGC